MNAAPKYVPRRTARFTVGSPSPEPDLPQKPSAHAAPQDELHAPATSRSGSVTPRARTPLEGALVAPKAAQDAPDLIARCIEKVRQLRDEDACEDALSLIGAARADSFLPPAHDAALLIEQARCEQTRGNFALACEQFRAALSDACALPATRKSSVYFQLAVCQRLWSTFGRGARPSAEQVRAAFKEAADALAIEARRANLPPVSRGFVAHRQGICAEGLGDFFAAWAHYKTALEIRERIGDERAKAYTLHRIAVVAQRCGDYRAAERAAAAARAFYRASGIASQNDVLEADLGLAGLEEQAADAAAFGGSALA